MLTPLIHAADPVIYSGSDPVRLKELEILGGLALFVIVIIAGYKFITSEGDPKKVAEARGTLTMAMAGVLILAIAYLILVIISRITGNTNVIDFLIYR